MSYKPAHARPTASRRFAAAVALILAAALAGLGLTTVAASAGTPPLILASPLTLGTPGCVTHDVIMNDPVALPNMGLTVTEGSDGSPVVHTTGVIYADVHYVLYSGYTGTTALNHVSIDPTSGVISASGATPGTYLVRVVGTDSVSGAAGVEEFSITVASSGNAVTYDGDISNPDASSVDNANATLNVALNASDTILTATAGNLALPYSDGTKIPIQFSWPGGVTGAGSGPNAGWNLSASPNDFQLTGTGASDPELEAYDAAGDVVLFTLSGLSVDKSGVFYLNAETNPCVTAQTPVTPPPDTVTVFSPGSLSSPAGTAITPLDLSHYTTTGNGDTITAYTATGLPAGLSLDPSTGVISGTPTTVQSTTVTVTAADSDETSAPVSFTWNIVPPSPPVITSGDYVNPYGNGPDVFRQHFYAGAEIAGWPATQHDPATRFILVPNSHGGNSIEEAPYGVANGLCLSNVLGGWGQPAGSYNVLGVPCNGSAFQGWSQSGGYLKSDVDGRYLSPNGTGAELTTDSSPVPWGGSEYHWVNFSSLPA